MKYFCCCLILFSFILPEPAFSGDCLPGTTEAVWPIDEVAGLASQKFSCEDLAEAIALAHAESGFKPFCVSSNGRPGTAGYSEDAGLWQMNDLRKNLSFEYAAGPQNQRNPEAHRCGLDPECNLEYTYRLWLADKGFNTRRWHGYQTEDYYVELAAARQFIRSHPEYLQQCRQPL
ncbi:MAG: transglycosylase SLT domain-containing protein [Candidatus Omnitrophica bacterium]|nr:transglycosylase SLT domain-containing protein [Candidatus Omnitrophota bacterium]MDE2223476.1 transglycosylase SLT domain-containing protein [Candidatus Omnitrophota bacterium]